MAEFFGVRLVTYCIMGNHFHALVEVPKREAWLERFAGAEGERKLFEHLRTLYSSEFVGLLKQGTDTGQTRDRHYILWSPSEPMDSVGQPSTASWTRRNSSGVVGW